MEFDATTALILAACVLAWFTASDVRLMMRLKKLASFFFKRRQ
jgi:hypothetical protein